MTQKISMTEEEEKENTAIKVTVEVKNWGDCVMHHWKDAEENSKQKVLSYLPCYSKAELDLKGRSCCCHWLTPFVHKHRQEMLKWYNYHNYYLCSGNAVVIFHLEFHSAALVAVPVKDTDHNCSGSKHRKPCTSNAPATGDVKASHKHRSTQRHWSVLLQWSCVQ